MTVVESTTCACSAHPVELVTEAAVYVKGSNEDAGADAVEVADPVPVMRDLIALGSAGGVALGVFLSADVRAVGRDDDEVGDTPRVGPVGAAPGDIKLGAKVFADGVVTRHGAEPGYVGQGGLGWVAGAAEAEESEGLGWPCRSALWKARARMSARYFLPWRMQMSAWEPKGLIWAAAAVRTAGGTPRSAPLSDAAPASRSEGAGASPSVSAGAPVPGAALAEADAEAGGEAAGLGRFEPTAGRCPALVPRGSAAAAAARLSATASRR